MNESIYKNIVNAQNDSEQMYQLIKKFDPLIRKYSYRLRYEDAYSDIVLLFIEKIQKVNLNTLKSTNDNSMLKYIKKLVQNISYNLYYHSTHTSVIPSFSLSEFENSDLSGIKQKLDCYYSTTDECPIVTTDFLECNLTPYQANIIKYIFLKDYSIKQVSKIYGVSEEAITISKNRALKKLKKNLSPDSSKNQKN